MEKFPEEIWVIFFEIVAKRILDECKLIDYDGFIVVL